MLTSPTQAADLQAQQSEVQPGNFVGARIKLPLGGPKPSQPQAQIALAPKRSRISNDGFVDPQIGEGVALNLNSAAKASLTVGGVPIDVARTDAKRKLGISNGGWVAIGLGVVALAAGGYFLYLLDEAEENSD
jgi:hypothetical protein